MKKTGHKEENPWKKFEGKYGIVYYENKGETRQEYGSIIKVTDNFLILYTDKLHKSKEIRIPLLKIMNIKLHNY